MRRLATSFVFLAFGAVAGLVGETPRAQSPTETEARAPIMLAVLDEAIGPATTDLVRTAIERAEDRDAAALVLKIDTPGGLVAATRDITAAILDAGVPVIGWVAPPGARAASAGTFIMYATHVAAMAPGTNIGAATPVRMGGAAPGGMPSGEEESDGEDASGDALERKATNDAVAWIRSLAEMRGRDADWAERAVRDAASISAEAAREKGVVEIVARDMAALKAALDGRTVEIDGTSLTLAAADAAVETVERSLVGEVLAVITNPNVAFLLVTLGAYGLIFELANPGIGPGVPGVILLVLGLYALNQLPIDYAGLALMGLGLAFIVAEAVTPTFGILGLGGVVAFCAGAAILIDTEDPAYRIDWTAIGGAAVLGVLFLGALLGIVVRAQRSAPRGEAYAMVGSVYRVAEWSGGEGRIVAHGERWRARGPRDLSPGDAARVTRVDGLTLEVDRADTGDVAPETAPDPDTEGKP